MLINVVIPPSPDIYSFKLYCLYCCFSHVHADASSASAWDAHGGPSAHATPTPYVTHDVTNVVSGHALSCSSHAGVYINNM